MLIRWPIRNKLLVGLGLLLVILGTLVWSGFHGAYAYRNLVRSLSWRFSEIPLAGALNQQVSDLRLAIAEHRGRVNDSDPQSPPEKSDFEARFAKSLTGIRTALESYRVELGANETKEDSIIMDSRQERQTLGKIDDRMNAIDKLASGPWAQDTAQVAEMVQLLGGLQALTSELPRHLQRRIHVLRDEVRSRYRTWIILTWITSISAGLMLAIFLRLFYTWVFRPLRVLVKGSRRVAAGEFSHRITLDTHDEMSELADAMNDMTARFQEIRDDLDRQVRERTQQAVRSEQLASVGFLAAGVAHEINNPLASIALCAESVESRVQELLESLPADNPSDSQIILNYLQMIQREAFRCKGITERLLDFSRAGDSQRQNVDLRELVQNVIDMVRHLAKYHDLRLELVPGEHVLAPVNPQEINQVVLNLITNALESLSAGGQVMVELRRHQGEAQMVFTDNGCGLTDEVREHLFEPFFTRRKTGQGIGLGLSITHRIVADHDGRIEVNSAGPGQGSQFRVSLPLAEKQKEHSHRYQAA